MPEIHPRPLPGPSRHFGGDRDGGPALDPGREPVHSFHPGLSDRAVKRERLLAILDNHPTADHILLTSPGATSWYLDGARVQVSTLNPPVLRIVIGREGDQVVTTVNEADRLRAEELPADIDVVTVPWDGTLPDGERTDVLTEHDVAAQLRAARVPLLPGELARFESLAADSAAILTRVLGEAEPHWTEQELSARIASDVIGVGAEPVVLLVGGASRSGARHPLPTGAQIGSRAMAVLGARRSGMIVNLTRWVRFDEASDADSDRELRLLQVEAAFLGACRVGETLGTAFSAGIAAYADNGFDPDEWRNHHQGGVAGYVGRDPRAIAETADVIREHQAFSWNPTAPGAKVEDTILLTADGLRVLTVDPAWPTVEVDGLARPVELRR